MTPEQFLERARGLKPALAARAAACEALRRVPDESFKDFQEAGLLRALQPRRFGGFELDPLTFYRAVMQVAEACPSSGWVLGVVGVHNWQLALFPEQAQRDVWGEDTSIQISSSYAPTGKVERAPGGFRVSGRWSFSSGCDHCQWVFLGGSTRDGDGPPDARTYLIPRRDYTILDNWHVAGLAGTGSKDILVEGAFVPEHRTHRFIDGFLIQNPGGETNPGPLYRLSFGGVFASALAPPAIGAAQGALTAFRDQTRKRLAAYDLAKIAEDPFAQVSLAEAAAEIDAARERFERDWRELWTLARAGRELPLPLRRRTRFDSAQAVAASIRAVDRLLAASGGRGIFLDNPIQRFFRDVHAMQAHAVNHPERAARMYGKYELLPDSIPSDVGDIFV